jgi:hypothetical protein
MPYSLNNNGATIKFIYGNEPIYIDKSEIRAVMYIRPDIVKIDMGDPLRNFYIKWRDIPASVAMDAKTLAQVLSTWKSNNDFY